LADEAIKEMREAIRLNPMYFRYHIDAAIMLDDMGRKAEALEEYNLAVERYPAKPAIRVYRARLEDALGMKDEARHDIDEAARLLKENRMPDGSIRHDSLELDTEQAVREYGSEKKTSEREMYDKLRAEYHAG
jgi:tetratricopeptide (TPR) repeat protein